VRLDPIVIVPYDPAWPGRFDEQRARLAPVLHPWLTRDLEHLGSTAVPGLPAKNIIDMLAVVGDIDAARDARRPLHELGWRDAPEPEDDADRQLSFCYPSVARRSHHLHVVEARAPGWVGWLAFRDYLRSNDAVARAYGELKVRLALEHGNNPDDRQAYRDGKADFVTAVTRRALADDASAP